MIRILENLRVGGHDPAQSLFCISLCQAVNHKGTTNCHTSSNNQRIWYSVEAGEKEEILLINKKN